MKFIFSLVVIILLISQLPGLDFFKTFLMHKSTEHERYHYNKCKMLTLFGILTFISIINTTSESFKARTYFLAS